MVRKIRGAIAEEEPLDKPPCSAVGKSSVYNQNFKGKNVVEVKRCFFLLIKMHP